jgi:ATP synthase protein I
LQFTGIAFTMATAIGLFTYGGIRLDRYLNNKTPWATIGGAIFGLTAGFYLALKDLLKP